MKLIDEIAILSVELDGAGEKRIELLINAILGTSERVQTKQRVKDFLFVDHLTYRSLDTLVCINRLVVPDLAASFQMKQR